MAGVPGRKKPPTREGLDGLHLHSGGCDALPDLTQKGYRLARSVFSSARLGGGGQACPGAAALFPQAGQRQQWREGVVYMPSLATVSRSPALMPTASFTSSSRWCWRALVTRSPTLKMVLREPLSCQRGVIGVGLAVGLKHWMSPLLEVLAPFQAARQNSSKTCGRTLPSSRLLLRI
jgi:hypothetical protein